jgi:hypothetical protein
VPPDPDLQAGLDAMLYREDPAKAASRLRREAAAHADPTVYAALLRQADALDEWSTRNSRRQTRRRLR